MPARQPRDHGGGLDAAIALFGGLRSAWLDLSTGINPRPYPLPTFPAQAWQNLPDSAAQTRLTDAARRFWSVPQGAEILAANGASALIAMIPRLLPAGRVAIPGPTYNEHAAAFRACGWQVEAQQGPAKALVLVHPNNPDGRVWNLSDFDFTAHELIVIDESFCDVMPHASLIHLSQHPQVIILKSFGKFWGLGGLRLGFAIGGGGLIDRLRDMTGPWPVSGPALETGATALQDSAWAATTRHHLALASDRLDSLATKAGLQPIGGTSLFRLYDTPDAIAAQTTLANARIWSRIFPYSKTWLRLGLPGSEADWRQLAAGWGAVE